MAKRRTTQPFFGKTERRIEQMAVEASQRGDLDGSARLHDLVSTRMRMKKKNSLARQAMGAGRVRKPRPAGTL